jgi:hypothetical protein
LCHNIIQQAPWKFLLNLRIPQPFPKKLGHHNIGTESKIIKPTELNTWSFVNYP